MANAVAKLHKVVSSLPGTLEVNSVYFVRVGTGFDVYLTNAGGTIAYGLNLPAGSATGAYGVAEVDFGATGKDMASVGITGQTGILAGSSPVAQLLAKATADHSIDEHLLEDMEIITGNVIAGTGFTIYARSRTLALRGKYSVAWSWR